MKSDTAFDNACVGSGTIIEPGVTVGFRYHERCGLAQIGCNGILRQGTIIYGDVTAGDYFQTGHYTVIRAKTKIGDYCTVSNHSTLEGLIRMGTGVRIMSHTYVPSRTWFGDHVFVGPGVTFLNDPLPGRCDPIPTPRGATIEDDVMIGGGVTLLNGITIGERSFIAAGAVVTKDVPPRTFALGCPAQFKPLPSRLDRPANRTLTLQPIDLWHPRMDPDAVEWPPDWPDEWTTTRES